MRMYFVKVIRDKFRRITSTKKLMLSFSACLSVSLLSISLCFCISLYLSVCLFKCVWVCVYVSIYLCVSLYISGSPSLCKSISLCISLTLSLTLSLSRERFLYVFERESLMSKSNCMSLSLSVYDCCFYILSIFKL